MAKRCETITVERCGVAIVDNDGEILQLHLIRDPAVAREVCKVENGVPCIVQMTFKKGTVAEDVEHKSV